jgi:hypothetical protein
MQTYDSSVRPQQSADELFWRPAARVLWGYRRLMTTAFLGIAAVFLIAAAAAFVLLPREKTYALDFRLFFEGIDRSEYPNGLRFSSTEIVSTPIVSEIYEKNDLKRYATLD